MLATPPHIAINIHSFSECPRSAIEWWISLLARAGVEHLFIVPNTGAELVSTEAQAAAGGPKTRLDFRCVLEGMGYREIVRQPKYGRASGMARCGLFPSQYFVFRLDGVTRPT